MLLHITCLLPCKVPIRHPPIEPPRLQRATSNMEVWIHTSSQFDAEFGNLTARYPAFLMARLHELSDSDEVGEPKWGDKAYALVHYSDFSKPIDA